MNNGDWRIDLFFLKSAQAAFQPCPQSLYPCEMRPRYPLLGRVCGPTAGLEALGRENKLVRNFFGVTQ